MTGVSCANSNQIFISNFVLFAPENVKYYPHLKKKLSTLKVLTAHYSGFQQTLLFLINITTKPKFLGIPGLGRSRDRIFSMLEFSSGVAHCFCLQVNANKFGDTFLRDLGL